MSFKVAVFFLLAGFFLASAPLAAAEPASIEAIRPPIQAPAVSPIRSPEGAMVSVEIPIAVPAIPAEAVESVGVAAEAPAGLTAEHPVAVHEAAVGAAEVRPAPQAARPVIVIEAPRRVSFELLRRESHRYPDQDMGSRFTEMGTETSPLFGEDF